MVAVFYPMIVFLPRSTRRGTKDLTAKGAKGAKVFGKMKSPASFLTGGWSLFQGAGCLTVSLHGVTDMKK